MEGKNKNTILKFLLFTQLSNWSSYALLGKNLIYTQKYPFEKIGSFLKRNKTQVTIQDGVKYKRATIRVNGNGISLRDEPDGREIGTKNQFLIRTDQFLLSKIDARNGAFGVVPPELNNGVITGNFWTFDVDYAKVNPHYLTLLMGTKRFQELSQTISVGTTNRNYLQEDAFLNFEIPFPSLEEQDRIVNAYNEKIDRANELNEEVERVENVIQDYLLSIFEIEKTMQEKSFKGLQFHKFQNIDRWDVWVRKGIKLKGIYPELKIKDIVLGKPMYGANVKGVKKHSNTRYIRITDINENGTLNNDFVSPEIVEEKYLLKENDFLIARSGNTVGKTFLFKNIYGRAIYAGYLVKYNIDTSRVIPEYLLEFTKSYMFKRWIESNQRIAGQPNINGQEFLQAPIILPSIDIQNEIISKIQQEKLIVKNLRMQAMKHRESAYEEFEKEIFG